MAPQDNAELIRTGYEAFAKGDLDTVSSVFAEDISWHVPGRSQISGDLQGRDQVLEFFGRLTELAGGTFRLEPHDLLSSEEHVVVLVTAHAERDGRSLDSRNVHVWHVRDGKASEFWGFSDDQYRDDAFWE